jgi:hypothetical protein
VWIVPEVAVHSTRPPRYLPGLLASLAIATVWCAPARAGATASSFKKETKRGANYFNGQSAIDGNLATAWMVPGESSNKGEWIMLDVPQSTVDKIGMVVGWAKSDTEFHDYARVKSAQVDVFSYDENQDLKLLKSAKVDFKDIKDMQIVDIPDVQLADSFGGKVKITILDIYPGKDYPNVAISELMVHLTEFDAVPTITAVSGEDSPRDNLVDDKKNTVWQAPSADASITFEAKGYSLAEVGLLTPGKDFDRPKKVQVTANDQSVVQDLPDKPGLEQWVTIPSMTGYTGGAWGDIELKFLDYYPGARNPGKVALSELDLKATAYEGI